MVSTDPKTVVLQFNECINNRDLENLVALMTEDHTFIDASGDALHGCEEMKNAWKTFFEQYPGYRNIFSYVESRGDFVIMIGRSECTEGSLRGSAIWTAVVENGRVAEWCVYEDSEEIRKKLEIDTEK